MTHKAGARIAVTNKSAVALDLILAGPAVEGVPPTRNVAPGETVEDAFDIKHVVFMQHRNLGLIQVGLIEVDDNASK